MEVPKGEFITIFGPNGAGKTTLIKLISTLLRPTSGNIILGGYDTIKNPIEVRKRIGVFSHDLYLYENLTAQENLLFFAKMFGLQDATARDRVETLITEMGLRYKVNDRVNTYSRGLKQRLSLARSLLHEPDVLLLDEPFTGLDQHALTKLNNRLLKLHNTKRTILMTTHDIEHGLQISNRICVLTNNRIVYDVDKESIGIEEFKTHYSNLITKQPG